MPHGPKPRPAADRFWEKVDKSGDCWVWIGAIRSKGYGKFATGGRANNRSWLSHRFAYELLVGPIPEGLQLDHLCRNPPCVNPAHLEPVTARVNLLRGQGLTAKEAATTHCPWDHPYDETNTFICRNGARKCRACDRIRQQRIRDARKQARTVPDS